MTDDDAIDDLAETLFAYEPGSHTTRQVTADITQVVVGWAVRRGWTARTEARIEVPDLGAARLGYVDVVVVCSDRRTRIAIEIDSADKPWSLEKLRYAAAAGLRAVWVRWGDDECAGVYSDIDVIQLPAARRPLRDGRETQLRLWT